MSASEPARMLWFGVGRKARPKRPAAGLLLISRETGRVLLNKRADWMAEGGTWSTPGGVADEEDGGELMITAVREFGEEMGVLIELDDPDIEYITDYTSYDHRRSYTVYVLSVDYEFDCWVDEKETVDYAWMDVEEAIAENVHWKLRPVLRDFR